MNFYSTKNPDIKYSLKQAVLQGLPSDNGLFMPDYLPSLPDSFLQKIDQLSFDEIAFEIASLWLGENVDPQSLQQMVEEVFNFEVPVVPVSNDIHCLELFHGPTLAFKDFGARFMSRLMAYLIRNEDHKPCILVATSGDTGSAVAQGFFKVPGIDVVILYPSGKVSEIQEKQLTTIGENVTALEIEGTFDDCQSLVKKAFLDEELRKHKNLTSANSINIARLLPQSFYYFQLYAKLKHMNAPIVCSVPSGNFGNLMGGLLAKRMGLPIHRFIAANNENKVFYHYLRSGNFSPRTSVTTISNAMDVGNPSNFARIMDFYQSDLNALSQDVVGYTFDDSATRSAITTVFQNTGYIMDPHGAIGYLGLQEYCKTDPDVIGVFLGTAHPIKFSEVVKPLVAGNIEIPKSLKKVLQGQKQAILMPAKFTDFKTYLMSS